MEWWTCQQRRKPGCFGEWELRGKHTLRYVLTQCWHGALLTSFPQHEESTPLSLKNKRTGNIDSYRSPRGEKNAFQMWMWATGLQQYYWNQTHKRGGNNIAYRPAFQALNCCSSSYVSFAEDPIYSHCSRCLISIPLRLVVLGFLFFFLNVM